MQERQQDADGHALLDRERQNRQRSREDQQKLGPASPPHVLHHADPHQAQSDEEEDARQRRGRQVGERLACEQENAERGGGGEQPSKLRPAARLRDDRSRRRACVHGERADEAGESVGRPDANEIPVDVRPFRAIGERARRRRGLHHHHERNEHAERRNDANVVPGHIRQRKVGRRSCERPERRHPARFETERNCRQSSEAKADESAGKAWAYRFACTSMIASTPRPIVSVQGLAAGARMRRDRAS